MAVFYFDLSSPFAYLSAARIGAHLPGAEWRPIAFGALIGRIGKVPWSLKPGPRRDETLVEIGRRAEARGLPPVVYPPGWPAESYSVLALRAALVAQEHGAIEAFVMRAYDIAFAEGRALDDEATVLEAAARAGLDPQQMASGIKRPEIKQRLHDHTDAAIARGVTGVPTFEVSGELFWGDDRLEDAARLSQAGRGSPAPR